MFKIISGLALLILVPVLATEFINASDATAGIQNKCTKHDETDPALVARPTSGVVKVIRLSNQGEFIDRCELTDVLDELVWDHPDARCAPAAENCFNSKVTIKPDAVSKPKLIVLYIHGWMHSSDDQDSNYREFRRLIASLACSDHTKQTVGIYITWNASTGYWPLDYLSFWSRQRIADRITQSAVVAKIVGTIGNTRDRSGKHDNFIAIGHSFGARMLFSAVNAPLVIDVARAYPRSNSDTYQIARGPADATLLLNPAFEAARYTAINGLIRNEEVFSPLQPPLLITISTNNDWATETAFPAGQVLDLSFDKRARTTLGNYDRYYTHSLLPSDERECPISNPSNITEKFFASGLCLKRETDWHQQTDAMQAEDPYGWSSVNPERQMFNPFLVVHTTKEVIDNHGGIWKGKVFSEWIFQVVKAIDYRNDRLTELDRTGSAVRGNAKSCDDKTSALTQSGDR
ncbi:hypothetical protein [Bradyrhizobium sp. Arg816]|uniref:hypothetical protein n=1 Tax=Bradyrhizobium sp. Arg816 TaxID=2998491 RepID=UPI00249E23A3|nr:hypothetical protein [Bradyrhizobium sp. Arg816]MDI3560193.1 hypothetical protein [Bradyrhizobium sp. Arg816]